MSFKNYLTSHNIMDADRAFKSPAASREARMINFSKY